MLTVTQKIEHLKSLGFSGDMTEIEKFYAGQSFNQNDQNVQNLIQYSTNLWQEFSQVLKNLAKAADENEKSAWQARKEQLLATAFPEHGIFGNFCDDFYCTVGAIDFNKEHISGVNKNVKFGKYTLAELGNFSMIGEDVKFGVTLGQDVQPNKKVIIGNDTWICASTTIGAGATVADGTVLALGACLHPNQSTEVNALAVGNPCATKMIIDDNYQSKKDNLTHRSEAEIKFIVQHIRNLGMDVDEAYLSALKGEKYNCFSARIAQITEFSHNLSYEYNLESTTPERRQEIIDILFPIKGKNFKVGQGLFVDILGLAKVGDNVEFGDNAFFAGNVNIGDNVRAGSNLVLAGIGHELPAAGRRLRDYQGVYGEVCEIGKIQIASDVVIGEHCTLAPGSKLSKNLADHCYVVGDNKIFNKQQISEHTIDDGGRTM